MTIEEVEVSAIEYPSSSLVDMIAYDEEDGTLYVSLNGSVYEYKNVMRGVYDDFATARSAGHFYGTDVRGKYPSSYAGRTDEFSFSVRPVVAISDDTDSPALDLGDKSWFRVEYTVTKRHDDTIIARTLEEAVAILKDDLDQESGVESFTITSVSKGL